MSKKIIDLKGKRFGRLTVIKDTGKRRNNGKILWLCRCDCGNLTYARSDHLKSKDTKSCGCLQKEISAEFISKFASMQKGEKHPSFKHGGSQTRLHRTWRSMKARCYNPNATAYRWYGGRGINICDEWRDNFIPFRDWALANGYNNDLTIDRVNNDENYSPSNCQWLTREENAKKARRKRGEKNGYEAKAEARL